MIPSSQLDLIAERPIYHLSAFVYKSGKTFSDNDITGENCDFTLNYDDFYITGNKFNVEGGAMPIGNCVSKNCTLSLKSSDKYTAQDFVGAHMVLTISAVQNDSDVEILGAPGGYYFVETVTIESGKINLECSDLMCKANKYYTYDVEFTTSNGYSTTTYFMLWKSVLTQMGIDAGDAPDTGYNVDGLARLSDLVLAGTYSFGVHNRLKNGKWTCREILEFIAMVTNGNVAVFPGLPGVYINSLLYYNSAGEYKLYGRTLKNNWFSFTDGAEAAQITGVKCVVSTDANGNDITPVEYHSDTYSDKYVLDVTGNPLIEGADLPTVALSTLYDYINLLPLHSFSGEFMAFPLLEYGDYVSATYLDTSGADVNVKSFITSFEFDPNGITNIACDVETGAENGQTFSSGSSSSTGGTALDIDSELDDESTNPVQNKVVKAALDKKFDKSGGTLTGNLTGRYLTGTWLQTTATTDLGSTPGKVAVLDGSGWVYYRTPAELLGDMGIQKGTATVTFSTSTMGARTAVTFPKAYSSKPVVIVQQVFESQNCIVKVEDVSKTGFTVAVPQMGSSGSRDVMWIAIGN